MLLRAVFLMVALSILFFWLPIIGPLFAGFVGGRSLRGRPKLALVAGLPAAIFIGVLAIFGWYFIPYPLAGLLSAGDLTMAILFDSLPLLVGAVLASAFP